MRIILCIWFFLVCSEGHLAINRNGDFDDLTGFPENFIFSTATASYQVEGAWNVSGKGENIWDRITHSRPEWVEKRGTGDVACDSYHKYKEDVKNLKNIGFQMYRFSLSWSRLFPTGYTSSINQDGVRYYSALIDELLSNGIEPMVTIYHWDLPQPLEDIGGWLNSDIADIFAEYARAVFKLFGDKVKWWVTLNEPQCITDGYGSEVKAPALNKHGVGEYVSGHNVIRAHAKAYRIYEKEFKKTQGGKVSIVISGDFHIPENASDATHIAAAERANQFTFGWYAHPIFSENGDYPSVMREYIDRNSKAEGLRKSRLPYFTKSEINEIKGMQDYGPDEDSPATERSFDYLGLNHYSSKVSKPGISGNNPSVYRDMKVISSPIPGALHSRCSWLQVTPEGFRGVINWMKNNYNNSEIFITENGYCGDTDEFNDQMRIHYHQEYLKNLLAAIKEDGCRVLGYTVWSLMDNFEWKEGYERKFGLMKVDFDSPERTRTMKQSANFFKELIHLNSVNKYSYYFIEEST